MEYISNWNNNSKNIIQNTVKWIREKRNVEEVQTYLDEFSLKLTWNGLQAINSFNYTKMIITLIFGLATWGDANS